MLDIIQFLFPPLIACLTMLGMFGYLGIHVIEREIIFIDIALAQIAAVGSTFALFIWHVEENSFMAYLFAFGFTILASWFYSRVGRKITQIPIEAVIGVSYAIAAAAALFLIAIAAGGDIHMEHMLTGSILWAKWSDIFLCAITFILVGIFHYIYREKFRKISQDCRKAAESGINTELWDFLFYITMGLVITLSVKIAGVLVIFSFLIIPSTLAAMFSSSWKHRIGIAWLVGFLASVFGLAFSYRFDFSCGPSIVSFLGVALIIAALIRKLKPTVV